VESKCSLHVRKPSYVELLRSRFKTNKQQCRLLLKNDNRALVFQQKLTKPKRIVTFWHALISTSE